MKRNCTSFPWTFQQVIDPARVEKAKNLCAIILKHSQVPFSSWNRVFPPKYTAYRRNCSNTTQFNSFRHHMNIECYIMIAWLICRPQVVNVGRHLSTQRSSLDSEYWAYLSLDFNMETSCRSSMCHPTCQVNLRGMAIAETARVFKPRNSMAIEKIRLIEVGSWNPVRCERITEDFSISLVNRRKIRHGRDFLD